MPDGGEFGIVANVIEIDRLLRKGAKVWLLSGWSGGGFERVTVRGASRSGRPVEKWLPIHRLDNFRAAWMPEHLRPEAGYFCAGPKEEMGRLAIKLSEVAERYRAEHPLRQFTPEPRAAES